MQSLWASISSHFYGAPYEYGSGPSVSSGIYTNTESLSGLLSHYTGVDYTVTDGSTAITVLGQTFQNYGTGTHTIAAEFRVGGDEANELKRTSQNYTYSSGSSSSNSSSSSGSSGGTSSNNATSQSTTNPVTAAQQSAQSADKSLPKLTIKLKGIDLISLADLKGIAAIAVKEGKTPWINSDTLTEDGKSVDVRVSINPALATKSMNIAGSTTSARALRTKSLFEKFFKNELAAVISLTQKGDFGQIAEICVRVPADTKVEDLVFYSYDPVTNTYRQIKDPNAWIDKNGYLHFHTLYANEIVISKGNLERR